MIMLTMKEFVFWKKGLVPAAKYLFMNIYFQRET